MHSMSIDFADMRKRAKEASAEELREMLEKALDALAQQSVRILE